MASARSRVDRGDAGLRTLTGLRAANARYRWYEDVARGAVRLLVGTLLLVPLYLGISGSVAWPILLGLGVALVTGGVLRRGVDIRWPEETRSRLSTIGKLWSWAAVLALLAEVARLAVDAAS